VDPILPDLLEHAILLCGCQDAFRFLGRILHGNFKGNSSGDSKKRLEDWRIKFTIKRCSIKMDDHCSVLRIETTINNPSEFIVCFHADNEKLRWKPMGKGVSKGVSLCSSRSTSQLSFY
jgi:hypothetical protein